MPRSKLGTLRQRQPGAAWTSQIRDPRTGKYVSKTWTNARNKTEAGRLHHDWCSSILGRRATTAGRRTVATLLDEWLDSVDVSHRSLNQYRSDARRIASIIGNVRLEDLDPRDIEHLVTELARQGAAHNTVIHLRGRLSAALNQAVTWGYLPRNPAATVKARKTRKQRARAQQARQEAGRDKKVPTTAELDRIVAAEPDPMWRTFWTVHRATGARPSETLNLHWRHVDLVAGVVRIEGTVTDGPGGDAVGDVTKTGEDRPVTIGADAVAALTGWRAALAGRGLVFAHPDAPVFPSPVKPGRPVSRSARDEAWKRACRRADVPSGADGRTLHGVRHWHASTLMSQGVNVQVIAARLGHSIQEVLNRYGKHVPPGADLRVEQFLSVDSLATK